MKKLVNLLSAIIYSVAGSFCCMAQTENADTLMKVESTSRLVITENGKGTQISVKGEGEDSFEATVATEYPEESKVSSRQTTFRGSMLSLISDRGYGCCGNSRWDLIMDGVCIGLNKASGIQPDGGLQWSKSFEISWLNCIGVSYAFGKTSVSLGLGFDWRNYKITTSDRILVATPGGGVTWSDVPEGSRVRNSRLKVFTLQLPLLFRAKIPGTSLYVKAGPVFDFNTYASLKTQYDDAEGNKCEIFTKELSPRRFTVDFFGSLSLCQAIGIYVRYSPMKVMDAADGLNFRPLTLGITIGI